MSVSSRHLIQFYETHSITWSCTELAQSVGKYSQVTCTEVWLTAGWHLSLQYTRGGFITKKTNAKVNYYSS